MNNLEFLIENENKEISYSRNDPRLYLSAFTSTNYIYKKICNRLPVINLITRVKNNFSDYCFKFKGKEYLFSIFSEGNIQKSDKERLLNIKERNKLCILRSLKLACSMDLVEPKIILGKSDLNAIECLISYREGRNEKVIDYANNIVMDKKDYYEVFNLIEYNTLDKHDLYRIYVFLDGFEDFSFEDLHNYLFFSNEIISEIGKNIPEFVSKYDRNGINNKNYLLFGSNADSLYPLSEDCETSMFYDIRCELDEFTLDPTRVSKYITYSEKDKKYTFTKKDFGSFEFCLLSDFFSSDKKNELFTEDRFGFCHTNSISIANAINERDRKYAYVVGGKVKVSEFDTRDHSWVEIDDGENSIVMDYNHNLIMNRDKYYKLYEASVIEKTQVDELVKNIFSFHDIGLNLHNKEFVYFGKELERDLKKNEKIFQKQ